MRHPTPEDIDEMRARGYDAWIVAEQAVLAERGLMAQALKREVKEAFAGVTLGDGIGLYEANGLDDYASEEKLAQYRARDERLDWSALPLTDLNRYSCSLSYYDAEGMRFHLPAYLLADLDGTFDFDLPDTLARSMLIEGQCALLTAEQRAVVRAYLAFIKDEMQNELLRDDIERALAGYWAA